MRTSKLRAFAGSSFPTGFNLVLLSVIFPILTDLVSSSDPCAKLQLQSSPLSLELSSGSVFGNLGEEYFTPDTSWNATGSWTVAPNCELKACDGVYLSGNCDTFSAETTSPAEAWTSAHCSCNMVNNDEKCQCSDIHLQSHICARAYLEAGNGCESCNAPYTELAPGTTYPDFPEVWKDKISSFLVRGGCTVQVYEEEENEGELETIDGPVNKEWNGPVGSYQCVCNNTNYLPRTVPTPASTVESVEIPSKLDDVASKFKEHNFNHPGLLAAFTSLMHKRSSRNAYILTIGSSGAGKSSVINLLLNRPNLTAPGDLISTTSEILEFRLPLPLPELGISNSELRIIDTPGLGDTRGLNYDAQFLATLDDYLSDHEELKTKIPNVVLVFHKFYDNRFDGEGAPYVKMLRGLDSFRTRITDENYSNVIFVFSHFCSVTNQVQKNPLPRLMRFKEVIEKYSLFPKPILTTVVENKGRANELIMRDGNYELPNGELFPQNLVHQLDTSTRNGNDMIGNAIFKAAFIEKRLGEEVPATLKTHHLVSSTTHSKVTHYLNILTAASYSIASTEVSKLLEDAYPEMSSTLKEEHPDCLEKLQRQLHLRNIFSKADVPQTRLAILELMGSLEQNEANEYLLDKGLGVTPPAFSSSTYAGYSFNILNGEYLTVTPFEMDALKICSIGFLTPDSLQCSKLPQFQSPTPTNIFSIHEDKQAYLKHRFPQTLEEVNASNIYDSITGKIADGNLVKDTSCTPQNGQSQCTFVVLRDYKKFEFKLNLESEKKANLSSQFLQRANDLQSFEQSNHDNVEKWRKFFYDYGTQVGVKAYGGGRVQFKLSLPFEKAESTVQEVFKSMEFLDDLLHSVLKYEQDPKEMVNNASSHILSLTFQGGNPAYHISDLSKLTLEEAVTLFQKWKQSLNFYPAVFPEDINRNMTQLIGTFISPEAARKFDEPFSLLLNSTLVYIPPPPPTPDPKVLEEIARQQREQEEKLKQLMEEKKRKEEEAERERQAAIEAQRLQDEQRRKDEERRQRERQEAEARQRAQEAERERQLQEEAARRRRQREAEQQRERERIWWINEQARRNMERAQREWEEQQERARQRRRPSCLKQGTKILLADYTEKTVEHLKIGDLLLDQDLKPTRVLGVSYEFLLTQKFYGFDNHSFFFTDTHLFVGGRNGSVLYTTSTATLYELNPLMEYLNVREFGDERGGTTTLKYFEEDSGQTVQREVGLYQDPKTYPQTTPIYFIQVDSPSGTYFAEGYVCRHEVPSLEHWPNTLSTLFSLFGTKGFEAVASLLYTIETIHVIDGISDRLQLAVQRVIDSEKRNKNNGTAVKTWGDMKNYGHGCGKRSFDDFDLDKVISKIFGNPTEAALSMELYGRTGSIMAKYLDNPVEIMDDCRVKVVQDMVFDVIAKEMELPMDHLNK